MAYLLQATPHLASTGYRKRNYTINQVYDDLAKKIKDADFASDISELFNKAKRAFERIIEVSEKVLPTQGIPVSEPFILFSTLLALLSIICAALTLPRKHSKKSKAVALVAAVAAVVVFFLTSGWNGIKLVNIWTLPIAILTIIPAWLMFQKVKEHDSQNDQQEAVR